MRLIDADVLIAQLEDRQAFLVKEWDTVTITQEVLKKQSTRWRINPPWMP